MCVLQYRSRRKSVFIIPVCLNELYPKIDDLEMVEVCNITAVVVIPVVDLSGQHGAFRLNLDGHLQSFEDGYLIGFYLTSILSFGFERGRLSCRHR